LCLDRYFNSTPAAEVTSRLYPSQLKLVLDLPTGKYEKLSWSSWLICSGRFTHNSGHPSAAGRAQTGKFADQRWTFYHCAMQPIGTCTHWQSGNSCSPKPHLICLVFLGHLHLQPLKGPPHSNFTFGSCSFRAVVPAIWNFLPGSLRSSYMFNICRRHLKTILFRAFNILQRHTSDALCD